jgi:hypothetical protein
MFADSSTEEASEEAPTGSHAQAPMDGEDPLPELRAEKPMLVCVNTLVAKELVGAPIVQTCHLGCFT